MAGDTLSVRTRELRRRVLRTARHVVGADGLGALTVARLSGESGVSNGSLYHHFGSRGGIVGALCVEAFDTGVRPILGELDDRPAADAVPAAASAYVRWCCADRARATLLYEGMAQVDDPGGVAASKADVLAPVAAWFARRARAGDVRPVASWELDPIVMAPAHECVRRDLLSGGGWSAADAVPAIGRAVWAIVRPTGVPTGVP